MIDHSAFIPSAREKMVVERAPVRRGVWSRSKIEQSQLDNYSRGRLTSARNCYREEIEAPLPRVYLYPTGNQGYRVGSGRVHY
jgi:hypothetical protein